MNPENLNEQANPQPSRQPQQSGSPTWMKGLLIVETIILIILAVALVWFVARQDSKKDVDSGAEKVDSSWEAPSDWQTFKSKAFAFEFKYPPGLPESEDFQRGSRLGVRFGEKLSISSGLYSTQDKQWGFSPKEWAKGMEELDSVTGEIEQFFIRGQKAARVTLSDSVAIYIKHQISDSTVEIIDIVAKNDVKIDQILSTLHFIEEEKIPGAPEGWGVYINESAGISFAYPPNYSEWRIGNLSDRDLYSVRREKALMFLAADEELSEKIIMEKPIPFSTQQDLESKLVENVVLGGSGLHPDFEEFEQRTIGDKEFYYIIEERFEGVVSHKYFYVGSGKLYPFVVVDQGVNWTDPNLDTESLPRHKELREILETLEIR